MKKQLINLVVLAIVIIACTDKKKTPTPELSNEVNVELEKVEKSLDEISQDVKTKSHELDEALNALDNI